jgi:hypothetical protein
MIKINSNLMVAEALTSYVLHSWKVRWNYIEDTLRKLSLVLSFKYSRFSPDQRVEDRWDDQLFREAVDQQTFHPPKAFPR